MKARLLAHRDFVVSAIDQRLYGSFIEHLGRAVYSGIYEPNHSTADKNGMRQDVIDLVRELDIPIVRYPGGNFVSAYNWEDGIGPRDKRPTRLDLAWHTSESNNVGIHEFANWCEAANTEMMLAVNLGSRDLDAARNFLEYVNHPGGTKWSDLRRSNGREEPWNVKLWCLGNEMDGPWQIGHKTADEYGRLAYETAKAMRAFDKSIELVVCGSSNPNMVTYPEWEATVLGHTYDVVDHISLHMYFNNRAGNTGDYLAQSCKLETYIDTVASIIDYVQAKKRSKKKIHISFDEWNVWYHSNAQDRAILDGEKGWPSAPPLLEDIYNFEDVLQVGLIINAFIRRADRVKIACLAQLVNVIAPIMTVPDGPAWRQTIFYPFKFASTLGRGTALRLNVDVPSYFTEVADHVPYLDASAILAKGGKRITFFIISRHQTETIDLEIKLSGFGELQISAHQTMANPDRCATNSASAPFNVIPKQGEGLKCQNDTISGRIGPLSYHVVNVAIV